jgi:mRNA-degrading endonuclease RelE of RelBE toxin-antitoxin system
MSESLIKYLQKQSPSIRKKLAQATRNIQKNDLKLLDIKKLRGVPNGYRCRVGKFRIVFERKNDFVRLVSIDTRGDAY